MKIKRLESCISTTYSMIYGLFTEIVQISEQTGVQNV